MFSDGAYNTFDPTVAENRKQLSWLKFVEIKSLGTVVRENNLTRIDFLNIDIEGNDLLVLEKYDWSVYPYVIAAEDASFIADQPHMSRIYSFLREKKYKLVGKCGINLIFQREQDIQEGKN